MLRITTHDNDDRPMLQLEGRLAGPWVEIVRDCWQQLSTHHRQTALLRIDLRAVTFVDAAGKNLLAEMSQHNAQFEASGCQMKAILAEIQGK